MNKLFDLSSKIAVVTGGAGLIGKALVKGLAVAGATVYLAELDGDRGGKAVKEFAGSGLDVRLLLLDITAEPSITGGIEQILSQSGRIDVWVNNAYPRTKDWGLKFEKIPFASWQQNVDWQLNSYCLCCQKIAELMKEQKSGSIINIASTYGVVAPDFTVYEGTQMTMPAAYAAIKGGIVNFSRYLASYYGRFGVRVNAISPGGVFDNQPGTFVENYVRKTLLGRMAKPEDFMGPVVFLASEASSYVTGQNLLVDGGWTAI